MSDILEKIYEQRKKEILHRGEAFKENDIYCPYCAHEQEDIWDWDLHPNGEEDEIQCQSCERYFAVKGDIVWSTRRLR
jgi:hypothetical protein